MISRVAENGKRCQGGNRRQPVETRAVEHGLALFGGAADGFLDGLDAGDRPDLEGSSGLRQPDEEDDQGGEQKRRDEDRRAAYVEP